MQNNFRVKVHLAIYDPFYQFEFESIREYFKDNYFLVIRISSVFYIKTYQSKEAVMKTLNRKFHNVNFDLDDPEANEIYFSDSEFLDKEILNRKEIKTNTEEEEFLNIILDKINKKEEVSLEEKFFLEYYSVKK